MKKEMGVAYPSSIISIDDCLIFWNKKMIDFVKEIGAKSHRMEAKVVMIIDVPCIRSIDLQISFKNGVSYGQSEETFSKAFNLLKKIIPTKP